MISILTACSNHNSETEKSTPDTKTVLKHDFVVRAPKKVTELTATFLNTGNGKTEDIVMEKGYSFSCDSNGSDPGNLATVLLSDSLSRIK